MRFSIIIPVYNVEKYIRKCMDSIMTQTFEDFEVIVVDDETPDNSMQIVGEFMDAYPGKIQVIHQKNTRQGGARNRGVREAKGEYILFVDSDDYVSRDWLKTVDTRLKENPCDILVYQYMAVTEEGKRITEAGFGGMKPRTYFPKRDKEILMLPCVSWNKAYRRSFYMDSQVQFPEKVLYEDTIGRLLYAKASSIALCEDCLYYYVQSGNSSIRRKNSEKMLDILKVADVVCEGFKKDGLYEEFKFPLEMSLIVSIAFVIDLINNSEKDSPLQVPLADYIAEHFPDYGTNPYVGSELRKSIDCLAAHDFRRDHYRFLMWRKFKEWLLCSRVIAKLNDLRK